MQKEILGATATLEFRLVNTNVDQSAAASGRVPGDSEVKQTREGQPVVLYKRVILTGDHITDSTSSMDEYNQPQVNISLDSAGGNIMSNFTKDNIGKPMATLFVEYKDSGKKDANGRAILAKEEEVINIANIQSRLGNSFRITGISNPNEARQLSLLLRAGADCADSDRRRADYRPNPGNAEHQAGSGSLSGRSGGLYPVHDPLL